MSQSVLLIICIIFQLHIHNVLSKLHPMQLFEIDGNWDVNNASKYDWASVLDGSRTANCGGTDDECQNQCSKEIEWIEPGLYSKYWTSGVFCDTYGGGEQSMLSGNGDSDPSLWVPLGPSGGNAGSEKYDLTNAYWSGSSVDMIMCAAMERITSQGASYVDFEFNQHIVWKEETTECYDDTDPSAGMVDSLYTTWKCNYPNRTDGDFQLSFIPGNSADTFDILVCKWNSGIVADSGGCSPAGSTFDAGLQWQLVETMHYDKVEDPEGTGTKKAGAIEAAINKVTINASPFMHVFDKGTPPGTTIEEGKFLEACIDWVKLGETSMCFEAFIIKTRAAATGAIKDSGGVIPFPICNNGNLTFDPTSNPTQNPTTTVPTAGPTDVPTTPIPSLSPTNPTAVPTNVPTSPTATPSNVPTKLPTQPTAPTDVPSNNPSTSPTEIPTPDSLQPSTTPTKAPIVPTEQPTYPTRDPAYIAPTRSPDEDNDDQGEDESTTLVGGIDDGIFIVIIIICAIVLIALIIIGSYFWRKREKGDASFAPSYNPSVQMN